MSEWRKKRNNHKKLRMKVFRRDAFICQLRYVPECHGDMSEAYARYIAKQLTLKRLGLTVDHTIPISKGGKWTLKNLKTACTPCNAAKASRIIIE